MAMCKLFRASINDVLASGGERERETRMMIKLNGLMIGGITPPANLLADQT